MINMPRGSQPIETGTRCKRGRTRFRAPAEGGWAYPRRMRRQSRLALALEAALMAQGLRVSARRLERWSGAGLGPDTAISFDEHVAHYAIVAALSASGRDDDVVALRLGGRGLPCLRLRGALLRRMQIPEVPPQDVPGRIDLLSESSSEGEFDPVFVEIETFAQEIGSAEPHNPLLHKILSAMRQNAARHSGALDEQPEDILHSYFVSIAWHMAGGEAYNVEAWPAIANVDPTTVGPDLEAFFDAVRPDPVARDNAYRHMPLQDITAIACGLAAVASAFLARFGLPPLSEPEIEEACCMFAPWAAYQFALMAPHLREYGLDTDALPQVFREILDSMAGEGTEAIGGAQPRLPALPAGPLTLVRGAPDRSPGLIPTAVPGGTGYSIRQDGHRIDEEAAGSDPNPLG